MTSSTLLLRGGTLVNEGEAYVADILIKGDRIERIDSSISYPAGRVLSLEGKYVLPGIIDSHVHFREPGLEHKGTILSETRAAVAGGITSFMEMPNTDPSCTTLERWKKKNEIASHSSLANYAFYMGATSSNIDLLSGMDSRSLCGVKLFAGSSTGDLLIDDPVLWERLMDQVPFLIAVHSESESRIRSRERIYRKRYGRGLDFRMHMDIRDRISCFETSKELISIAESCGSRLHILHLSTAEECSLFNTGPVEKKRISSEVCLHHLWFSDEDYTLKGGLIKVNPSVKTERDRDALWQALRDDRIDIVSSDHAPHTWAEKQGDYFSCPSGIPSVGHTLIGMLSVPEEKRLSIEEIVNKMSQNPARLFHMNERGFLREGYFADLVVVDPDRSFTLDKEDLYSSCAWSPWEGTRFEAQVLHTIVSGHLVFSEGRFDESRKGMALSFQPL
ncbi:MAG: dihydroorotase [Cytophagales bacterium]|nr:dihydroorotase [Cytophagales bacterium]